MWINELLLLLCFFHLGKTGKIDAGTCEVANNGKFDCFPDRNQVADQESCEARGCCWVPVEDQSGVPSCFYPLAGNPSYVTLNATQSDTGVKVLMQRASTDSVYPNPVDQLQMEATWIDADILRIRYTDVEYSRYEPPYPDVSHVVGKKLDDYLYTISINMNDTGFRIIRNSDNNTIIDTVGLPLIFTDQFIQFSSRLASPHIYGLGEHQGSFKLPLNYTTFTLFAHDAAPQDGVNIYGSHPFYLAMEESGNSHGVFLLNSNAMDITLQPTPAITYRTIGGILDFFYFLGPTPKDVLRQYARIIGSPAEVPFWAFGFHLCRWGVGTLNETKRILQQNLDLGIPVEVQWNDLDYMDARRDFLYDNTTFAGLPEFVDELHSMQMRYIPIIDPAINYNDSYAPFVAGSTKWDIFIKDDKGDLLLGQVWPDGNTVYPDFTHTDIVDYWQEMLETYHNQVPFDGVWIDMNEPSNFLDGSLNGCSNETGLDNPPYLPHVSTDFIYSKTICMSAKQYLGNHYDLHNLYGLTEARATNLALKNIIPERTVIVSRSTFAGSGVYGQHWTGDVFSTWDDLKASVPALLNFGLFLIPFVGADICGFNGNTTEALCNRWIQLGAFYPFSRSHNTQGAIDQDPAAFSETLAVSAKNALGLRYVFLTYIYTSYMAVDGYEPLLRPLFYEFPEDSNTYDIDTQFLLGPAIMVIPVLTEDAVTVEAYIPEGVWFDMDGVKLNESGRVTLPVISETIPMFVRGGHIFTTQNPGKTTTETRANPINVAAFLDDSGSATGTLFWDDGVTFDTKANNRYTLVTMEASTGLLVLTPSVFGEEITSSLYAITVANLGTVINEVLINNQSTEFYYSDLAESFQAYQLDLDLNQNITVTWS